MKQQDSQNPIFITWAYSRHGVAFFLQSIRAMINQKDKIDNWNKTGRLDLGEKQSYSQYEPIKLDKILEKESGLFEKAYFLVPDDLGEWESNNPDKWKEAQLKKREIQNSIEDSVKEESKEVQKAVLTLLDEKQVPTFEKAKAVFIENNADLMGLWHLIHDLRLEDQLKWFKEVIGTKTKLFEIVPLNISNLEDVIQFKEAYIRFIKEKELGSKKLLVNLYGTGTESQIAWYFLSWHQKEVENAVLVKIRDSKQKTRRFGDITIEQARKDLLRQLSRGSDTYVIPENTLLEFSKERLRFYIEENNLFPIFLLGERGTGKTSLIEDLLRDLGKELEVVNCASFSGVADYNLVRSELFGHVKDAFTGANKDKEGAFQRANKKCLFLDEIHHLDPMVQADLLRSLQTDKEGNYRFRKVGGKKEEKVKFQLLCASNKTWEELIKEKNLLADFLDRISQRVIKLPSLSEERQNPASSFKEVIGSIWNTVWNKMKFQEGEKGMSCPIQNEPELLKWQVKEHPFAGNYRDIDKAVIQYHDWFNMDSSKRTQRTALEYIKDQFKYTTSYFEQKKNKSLEQANQEVQKSFMDVCFEDFQTPEEAVKAFRQKYAEFFLKKHNGNKTKTAKDLALTTTTLNNWLKGNGK